MEILLGIGVVVAIVLLALLLIRTNKIVSNTNVIESIKKQNEQLSKDNKALEEKIGVIDRLVFKSKLILDEMKKKDSTNTRIDNVKGRYNNHNNSQLKTKIDEAFNDSRITTNDNKTERTSNDH